MEDLSYSIDKVENFMPAPFGPLVESIVELDKEGSSMIYSQGFKDRFSNVQFRELNTYLKSCLKQISQSVEIENEELVGQLDMAGASKQVLYLFDPEMQKTNLFFFEKTPDVIPISELLTTVGGISRVNAEMFAALKSGEAGLDHASLLEIANVFLEALPERLNKLAVAMKNSSWKDIVWQTHYLKSSFGIMGMERLSWLVSSLEMAGKRKELSSALANYQLLYPELLIAVRFLRKQLTFTQ